MELPAAEGAADEDDERPGERAGGGSGDASPPAPPAARGRGVDAGTQADSGSAEWTSYDLRRAMRLLHSTDDGVVRRTLRRLHIRFWHASTAKLVEILRLAGAPPSAQKLVKEIVDTCRVCRMWSKPAPKSMTTTRMARDFNHIVQWDMLFHRKVMVSHLVDEAIRWTSCEVLPSRSGTDLVEAIMTGWVRHFGPMQMLIADGERGLVTEHVSQFLDRVFIQLKTKAPGEHAQMVERH